MPVGPQRGLNTIGDASAAGVAWFYNPVTGEFTGNTGS